MAGLLLAAGRGTRFGPGNKLLADWRGTPVVVAAALALRRAVDGPCIAVIRDVRVGALLPGYALVRIAGEGGDLSQSLARGMVAVTEARAERVLIALGDMPAVPPTHLRRLVDCCTETRPSASGHDGRPGVPACLPRSLFAAACAVRGDIGARRLLTGHDALLVPLAPAGRHDIDRPGDLRPDNG